jgi:hypothetical protein
MTQLSLQHCVTNSILFCACAIVVQGVLLNMTRPVLSSRAHSSAATAPIARPVARFSTIVCSHSLLDKSLLSTDSSAVSIWPGCTRRRALLAAGSSMLAALLVPAPAESAASDAQLMRAFENALAASSHGYEVCICINHWTAIEQLHPTASPSPARIHIHIRAL